MSCDCKFDGDPGDPDEATPETSWHYRRFCVACGESWFSLHCRHDGVQKPCPFCAEVMAPEPAL